MGPAESETKEEVELSDDEIIVDARGSLTDSMMDEEPPPPSRPTLKGFASK